MRLSGLGWGVGMGMGQERAQWGARPASRGSSVLLPLWWGKLRHTLMPQFPFLSVGITVLFESLAAPSGWRSLHQLLRVPDTICGTVVLLLF